MPSPSLAKANSGCAFGVIQWLDAHAIARHKERPGTFVPEREREDPVQPGEHRRPFRQIQREKNFCIRVTSERNSSSNQFFSQLTIFVYLSVENQSDRSLRLRASGWAPMGERSAMMDRTTVCQPDARTNVEVFTGCVWLRDARSDARHRADAPQRSRRSSLRSHTYYSSSIRESPGVMIDWRVFEPARLLTKGSLPVKRRRMSHALDPCSAISAASSAIRHAICQLRSKAQQLTHADFGTAMIVRHLCDVQSQLSARAYKSTDVPPLATVDLASRLPAQVAALRYRSGGGRARTRRKLRPISIDRCTLRRIEATLVQNVALVDSRSHQVRRGSDSVRAVFQKRPLVEIKPSVVW